MNAAGAYTTREVRGMLARAYAQAPSHLSTPEAIGQVAAAFNVAPHKVAGILVRAAANQNQEA